MAKSNAIFEEFDYLGNVERESSRDAGDRQAQAEIPSESTKSSGARIPKILYERIFGFSPPKAGVTTIVGTPESGSKQYLSTFSQSFTIRGSALMNSESFNALVGSGVGYIGSDSQTKLYKYLSAHPSGTIIISGIESSDPALLEDLLSQFASGTFQDKAGNFPELKIPRLKVIVAVNNDLSSGSLLDADQMQNELRKLTKSNGSMLLPEELISTSNQIVHFYDLRKHLDRLEQIFRSVCTSPAPVRTREAAELFELSNEELFRFSKSVLSITRQEGETVLSIDGEPTKSIQHLQEKHYSAFLDNLDGFHGQEDAATAVKTAMMIKLDSNNPRPVSMLCVGPPGVGKTEIAKRLGQSVPSFVRLNGNTISQVSDIVGAAHAPGELNQLVKGVPTVILIDEFEKLSGECMKSLLQIIDEGIVTDNYRHETWLLRDALIIMTSNVIKDPEISEIDARNGLKSHSHIPEELVDRIDIIVPFRHFSREVKLNLAKKLSRESSFKLTDSQLEEVIQAESIRQIQNNFKRVCAESRIASFDRTR